MFVEPTACRNETLLHSQPAKRRAMVYVKPYKKPTLEMESKTTYNSSYVDLDCTLGPRISYEPRTAEKTGEFCFETMYELSYQASTGKIREPFLPRPQLSINGSHDMETLYKTSYSNPGYVKTASCKPYVKKIPCSRSMDCKTVMKESYQRFEMPRGTRRPQRPGFWRTKFKTDYRTTNTMSYQHVEPVSKELRVFHRPVISAPFEGDSVYNLSYRTADYFRKM